MIMNIPVKQYGEGDTHFKSKIRVANLADKIYDAKIFYEYNFEPVPTDEGLKSYIGDIVAFLQKANSIYKVIDIELDGRKGHGTKIRNWRNSIRDQALGRGVPCRIVTTTLDTKYKTYSTYSLSVQVKRMTAYLHNVDDSDIIAELA